MSRPSDDAERTGEDRFVCPDYLKRATVEGLDASYLGSHYRTGRPPLRERPRSQNCPTRSLPRSNAPGRVETARAKRLENRSFGGHGARYGEATESEGHCHAATDLRSFWSPSGMEKINYAGYRFSPEIIDQAIWLYLRFTLSLRDVEDLLAERGVAVSYETVRRWVNHFGPMIAADLRKRRLKPHTTWHLDEVYLKIDGRMVYLWRAVDAEGEVLDVLVQSKRNKHAALKLMRKLWRKYAFVPERLVTNDLRSYSAAVRVLGIERRHKRGRGAVAPISLRPTDQRRAATGSETPEPEVSKGARSSIGCTSRGVISCAKVRPTMVRRAGHFRCARRSARTRSGQRWSVWSNARGRRSWSEASIALIGRRLLTSSPTAACSRRSLRLKQGISKRGEGGTFLTSAKDSANESLQ